VDYEDILAKVKERDRIDSTRDVAPLKAADDAVVIDSNKLDVDEVLEKVLGLCR
jgi:cytidylate kinase